MNDINIQTPSLVTKYIYITPNTIKSNTCSATLICHPTCVINVRAAPTSYCWTERGQPLLALQSATKLCNFWWNHIILYYNCSQVFLFPQKKWFNIQQLAQICYGFRGGTMGVTVFICSLARCYRPNNMRVKVIKFSRDLKKNRYK